MNDIESVPVLGVVVRTLRRPENIVPFIWERAYERIIEYNSVVYDWFTEGTAIFDEDWDTMIVLDACRYDLFASRDTPGTLESRHSLGSSSPEWMAENFEGRTLHDTVYTTANAFSAVYGTETFHAINDLFETDWSEFGQTVRPGTVADAAIDAHEQYPDKRHLVHFMQPHYPFLGETGLTISHRGYLNPDTFDDETEPNIWTQLANDRPNLPREKVVRAYAENLDVALPHVERLLNHIDGKVIITADHGNLIGERQWPIPIRGYGHPGEFRVEGVRKVPWATVDAGPRREIVSERPERINNKDDYDDLESKLQALGYADSDDMAD